MKRWIIGFWIALPHVLCAQSDTVRVLSREALLKLVLDNHPAIKQALLRDEMAVATERAARGGFDPRAEANYREKSFDDELYYGLLDAGLRIPTWFGADLFAGFENTNGPYANLQERTPADGLLKAGVEVQVGQGLFIDRRRAELRRAFAYRDLAEAEKRSLLNDVFFQVLTDHVDWVAAYQRVQVSQLAVSRATIRMDAVRGSYRGGDRPAIDTLEALLQLQDRQLRLREAETSFTNAGLVLSNHLWDPYLRPLELAPEMLPDTLGSAAPAIQPALDAIIDQALQQHPQMLDFRGRMDQLEVDRRFRSEMFKPQLSLNYTLLADGGAINGEGGTSLNGNDRMWGFNFSMPLLLRKERGELALATLRITEAELGVERVKQEIRTTIETRYNELLLMQQQVDLGLQMVNNYRSLYQGENSRFLAGESSLFLVNQREVALIDSRLKQVDREMGLRRALFKLERDAGVLWSNYLSGPQ